MTWRHAAVFIIASGCAWLALTFGEPETTQTVGPEGTQCILRHTEHMPRNNPTHEYWRKRST